MKRCVTPVLMALLATAASFAPQSASATMFTLGFPDVVLEFFDSGAGPIAGPYGNARRNGAGFGPVSPNVILGFDTVTSNGFVSLPTGSFITLGFTDEIITNGPGNDIFISEVGIADEEADIFVSSDLTNFILLGTARNTRFPFPPVNNFDLSRIGFGAGDIVRAIRVVGRDNFGTVPGYDLNAIQITSTSFVPGNPNIGAVPEPVSWALMIAGFGLVGSAIRRRRETPRVTYA